VRDGEFVWADSQDVDFEPLSMSAGGFPCSFNIRACDGIYFVTGVNEYGYQTAGPCCPSGSGAFVSSSDRQAKENFLEVNTREVLDKVVALPMQTWNYKSQDPSIRHMGMMGQDFKTAFGVGETDKGINTVDADGVALAAIQGLNQKVEDGNQRSEVRSWKWRTQN
jgi:hypothetical protein